MFGGFPLVVIVVGVQLRVDTEVGQQFTAVPGILHGDQFDIAQRLDGAL